MWWCTLAVLQGEVYCISTQLQYFTAVHKILEKDCGTIGHNSVGVYFWFGLLTLLSCFLLLMLFAHLYAL